MNYINPRGAQEAQYVAFANKVTMDEQKKMNEASKWVQQGAKIKDLQGAFDPDTIKTALAENGKIRL